MTAQEICLRGALSYSGVPSLSLEDNEATELSRGVSPGLIADVAAELNAAIQELAEQAPHLFKQNGGGILLPPVTATGISATEGSTTISGFAAYTASMRGCTIRVTGDDFDNEIVSATELARPYLGTTAAALGATIYFDCIPLATTISNVVAPVMIPGIGEIFLANSRAEFLTGTILGPRVGRQSYSADFPYSANFTKQSGRPIRWLCEERYDASADGPLLLLRFYPMPAAKYGVVFQKIIKPPTYTSADVDNDDGGADPGTVIPFSWAQSILLPMLKQRWTSHSSFDQPDAKQEIFRQYQAAMKNAEAKKPTRGPRSFVYTNR